MSRAFMKESEPGEPACPGCATPGDPVARITLEGHLPKDAVGALGDKAFYCLTPACATAYFNGWGTSVPAAWMTATAYPKDPGGPVCPCFGLTVEDVLTDAQAGRKDRVKEVVDKSQGPEAKCVSRAPDGRPCVPRVLRLFRENYSAP